MSSRELLSDPTYESILSACDRLMARMGFRKMSIEDVAKEAGVSRRTVYLHFANKADLGLSSIGRVVWEVYEEMLELVGKDGDVGEQLGAVLRLRVLARLRRVREYASSLDELFEAVRPAYMERREEAYTREKGVVADLIRKGIDAGVFRDVDPDEAGGVMILATNAFVPYSLSPDELGSEEEVAKKLDLMVDLLVASVRQDARTLR